MQSKRIVFSAYLSNSLEFFDYTLFAALTPVIQSTFFCNVTWITPNKLSIFAFCISLIVRPLGGLLFGYIGDRISRLLSLKLSIFFMTLASILFAVLPGQNAIGDWAVWGIFFCRFLQGISAGGEYNGAAIVSIESNSNKSYLISGFMTSSAMMGLVLASLAAYILNAFNLPSYAWRFFVAFGALIGIASLFLRRVEDTKTNYTKQKINIFSNLQPFITIFFIGGQTSALGYFIFVNVRTYIADFLEKIDSNLLIAFSFFITAVVSVLCGLIAQKNIKNNFMYFAIKCTILFSPLGLLFLGFKNILFKILGLLILSILTGMHGSCQHIYFQSIVPQVLRQRIISLAFSLGTGIIGSLIIWVSNSNCILKVNELTVFSPYILLFSFISFFGFIFAKNTVEQK